ncbi:ribonuclease E/G [Qipengyuania atrilutea]|uniref:Ribonuclease E/G n=1 Tax=Qipengyuania atrilutea TaxID=2744473 RepID=A0A850H4Q5_9SPHN|nr:ribonuclease E/G [Actirhodobacter atriluteus]NVD45636.1 ribonuclease E/G [Actirhodobacter atriluteus]
MGEWLVEQGIGEQRALLMNGDTVLAAKMRWPGDLPVGAHIPGKLLSKPAGRSRGLARLENGTEVLLDRIPPSATEGSALLLVITRTAIAERGRFKRAQARVIGGEIEHGLVQEKTMLVGDVVRRFPAGAWEDVWDAASSGEIAFAGGTLLFSVTPAMTVIDIDGSLPPRELALAAVPPLARALRLFDLGGSIAIDFPTLPAKADRKVVDAALEDALRDWPHERTAMNGFGLVQIVARLEGPSLLHRFAASRIGMAARMALRRAEMVDGPGVTLLTVHPALKAKLEPEWLGELERRTGRPVRVETDPGLAIEAGQAQIVPHE